MSKIFRRGIALAGAAALLAQTLSGCAGKAQATAESTVDLANADPFGKYQEQVTYTMGRPIAQNSKMPEGDTYEDNAYTRLVEEQLNAVCVDEFEANGDAYERQVSLSIAAGDIPDFMRVTSKDILDELVENDLVEDMTDIYNAYASDKLKALYDSYDGRCLATATYDGRLMAMPGACGDGAPCITWVREDWLDALNLGIDPEGDGRITLDELEKMAVTFKAADPDKTGNPVGLALNYALNANDYSNSTYCMTGIAGALHAFPQLWLDDGAGEVTYGSLQPQTKEALGVLHDWFEAGILDPQFGTRTWDDITALLTNGQTGITFGVWHIPDWLLNSVRATNPKARFKAFVIEDEAGKVNVYHNNASNGYMVIRKGYAHPELAIKIMNLFFDKLGGNQDFINQFPEVKEYVNLGVDNSTRPFNIEVSDYHSLLDDYSDVCKGVAGTIKPEEVKTVETLSVIDSVKKYLADPENAEVVDWSKYHSRMVGIELIRQITEEDAFAWVSPVYWGTTQTMESKWANLQKLEEETFIKMVTGDLPMTAFEDFVAKWNAQGGTEILAEIAATLQDGEETTK